jgi:hypothetical protein
MNNRRPVRGNDIRNRQPARVSVVKVGKLRKRRPELISFGILMAVAAGMVLLGWYWLDWNFVNPFIATLFLISAPFFVGMGITNPRPGEVEAVATVGEGSPASEF